MTHAIHRTQCHRLHAIVLALTLGFPLIVQAQVGTCPGGTDCATTVFIIMMENHDWSSIKGSARAPYINKTLLPAFAHAENYRTGTIYPSLPNYITLEAGDNFGLRTLSPLPTAFRINSPDHLTSYLNTAGISWRSYSESLPGAGTTCAFVDGPLYSADHNAFAYFDDVTGNPPAIDDAYCIEHVRPYEELAADLQNGTTARYNFIIPNDADQGEKVAFVGSNKIAQCDTWLKNELPKILASQAYQDGGVVLILWDEDTKHGLDNPIGLIVVSPFAKPGYSNVVPYSHASTLRTVQEIFGVMPLLRNATTANDLSDLFTIFPPGGPLPSTTSTTAITLPPTSTSSTSSTSSTRSSTTVTSTSSTPPTTSASPTSTSSTTPVTTTSLPATGLATYQAGVGGPAGSANIDTNIRLSTPTTNWGTDSSLYVGVTNGLDKIFRTVIAFHLAGIPTGATIRSCTLTVNVTQRTNPTPGHVRRLCAEHWLDGDGQSEAQATWTAWKTGTPWGAPGAGLAACSAGGDYATDGETAYTPPAGVGSFTFPDLTPLCQDALARQGGWLRLRVSQDAEAIQSNLLKLDSSDATTASNRPQLTVTW